MNLSLFWTHTHISQEVYRQFSGSLDQYICNDGDRISLVNHELTSDVKRLREFGPGPTHSRSSSNEAAQFLCGIAKTNVRQANRHARLHAEHAHVYRPSPRNTSRSPFGRFAHTHVRALCEKRATRRGNHARTSTTLSKAACPHACHSSPEAHAEMKKETNETRGRCLK